MDINVNAQINEIKSNVTVENTFTPLSTFQSYTASTSNGGSLPNVNKIIYVAKSGNDNNSGNKITETKLTIQAAINAASSGDTVQIIDGEVYQESITTKNEVNIIGESAYLDLSEGRQMIIGESYVKFRSIFRNSGSNVMIQASGNTDTIRGYAVLDLNEIDDSGSGVTIQNGLNIPLDLHIKQVYIRNNNVFLKDLSDSTSHTHVTFDDLYLYSDCTGFELSNGGNVLGNIQHIKELGSGIGNGRAFNIIDGEVNIICPDARASIIADIEENGAFRFTSQRFSGAVNNNGGQYSYSTMGDDNGNMRLSTNLDITLDSQTLTLPQQSGNTGSFLTIGSGGLINYTTLTEPGLSWEDNTEGVTTVNTTTESIVYSITVDQNVTNGNISYVLNYTPGFFMNVTARLRRTNVTGEIIDSRSFNGSGSQTLSYSLPITSGLTVNSGDTFVLTVQFASANPGNTVNGNGFLTLLKTGSIVQNWSSIVGDPLENDSLSAVFQDVTGNTGTIASYDISILSQDDYNALSGTGYNNQTLYYISGSTS